MSRNPNPPLPPRPPVPPRRAPIPVSAIAAAAAARAPAAAPSAAPVVRAVIPSYANEPPIVARAGTYYRTTRYIMIFVLVGGGGWFAYDGWHGYPTEMAKHEEILREVKQLETRLPQTQSECNQKYDELSKYKSHSKLDIKIQQYLGVALPIGGILMLLWMLYNSRGVYRLSGPTLEVPGHPPVLLDNITQIDQILWERKGIAFIQYQTSAAQGRIRLDDFIYERDPTDAIFQRVEQHFAARKQA